MYITRSDHCHSEVPAISPVARLIVYLTISKANLMWKAKWSSGKLLYFCARYPVAIEGILWLICKCFPSLLSIVFEIGPLDTVNMADSADVGYLILASHL